MTDRLVRHILRLGVAVSAMLLCMASPGRAQDAGTITGVVVDAGTRAPIPSAQVQIVGSTRGVVTGDDGRFRIAGVRPGAYVVRVLRLGYQGSSQAVNVTAGGNNDLSFALPQAAVSLEQVVTTATGEGERKREIGSAVATLQPAVSQVTAAQNISQLLTGKVAGIDVQQA